MTGCELNKDRQRKRQAAGDKAAHSHNLCAGGVNCVSGGDVPAVGGAAQRRNARKGCNHSRPGARTCERV